MTDITPCTLCGRQHPPDEACGPGTEENAAVITVAYPGRTTYPGQWPVTENKPTTAPEDDVTGAAWWHQVSPTVQDHLLTHPAAAPSEEMTAQDPVCGLCGQRHQPQRDGVACEIVPSTGMTAPENIVHYSKEGYETGAEDVSAGVPQCDVCGHRHHPAVTCIDAAISFEMSQFPLCDLCGRHHQPSTGGCELVATYAEWPAKAVATVDESDKAAPVGHPATTDSQPLSVADRMGATEEWVIGELQAIYDAATLTDGPDLGAALKAVELVMRHRGMLNDHTTHSGSVRVEIVGIQPESLR